MAKHWALQEAKARFSELVRASSKEPQHITVRGEPTAVILSVDEYRRLSGAKTRKAKPKSFAQWWDSSPRVPEFKPMPRKREAMRKIEF